MKVNAQERAAIVRMVDTFDAEVMLNITPPPTIERKTLAKLRYRAEELTGDCQACGLCEHTIKGDVRGPVFPQQSMTRSDLIVLTPHPEPANGKYTRIIRHALSMVDTVTVERVSFVPVTGCVPRVDNGSLRASTRAEVKTCEANMYRAMDAANSPSVLMLGKGAMQAWRPNLTVEAVDGMVCVWRDQWEVAVVEHPAAAVHEGKAAILEWQRKIARAVRMLHAGDVLDGMGGRCVMKKCNEPVFAWDQDAVPWCRDHVNVVKRERPREYVDQSLFGDAMGDAS